MEKSISVCCTCAFTNRLLPSLYSIFYTSYWFTRHSVINNVIDSLLDSLESNNKSPKVIIIKCWTNWITKERIWQYRIRPHLVTLKTVIHQTECVRSVRSAGAKSEPDRTDVMCSDMHPWLIMDAEGSEVIVVSPLWCCSRSVTAHWHLITPTVVKSHWNQAVYFFNPTRKLL